MVRPIVLHDYNSNDMNEKMDSYADLYTGLQTPLGLTNFDDISSVWRELVELRRKMIAHRSKMTGVTRGLQ